MSLAAITPGVCPGGGQAGTLKESDTMDLSVEADLGQDLGQNFGTLFEAVDVQGGTVAGDALYIGTSNRGLPAPAGLHIYDDATLAERFRPRPLCPTGRRSIRQTGHCPAMGLPWGTNQKWEVVE